MKYLVIGLGNTGLSLLSMLKNSGFDVQGYNRPGESLRNLSQLKNVKWKDWRILVLRSISLMRIYGPL